MEQFKKVNRLEVINHSSYGRFGRVFTMWEDFLSVSYDLQDGGRTLKIFIDNREPFWTTAEGKQIPFTELTDDHLNNIIKDGYKSEYIEAEAKRRGFDYEE